MARRIKDEGTPPAARHREYGGSWGGAYADTHPAAPRRGPGPHAGKGPRNARRSDDRIREEVSEALTRDGDIDASGVEVDVVDGVVAITGTVPDRATKKRIVAVVEGCPGVRAVRLAVKVA